MSTVRFRYEGVLYQVEVVRDGDLLIITHEEKTYRVELEPQTPAAARPVSAALVSPSPVPAVAPPLPAAAASASAGPGVLPAPMTGTIKEVRVADGDTVSTGQIVVVMEAMKMDIDVAAIAAGTVAEVHVAAGDNRAAGQPLLTIQ